MLLGTKRTPYGNPAHLSRPRLIKLRNKLIIIASCKTRPQKHFHKCETINAISAFKRSQELKLARIYFILMVLLCRSQLHNINNNAGRYRVITVRTGGVTSRPLCPPLARTRSPISTWFGQLKKMLKPFCTKLREWPWPYF